MLGKATKSPLETLSIMGERACGWHWKKESSRVARFSKYK